MTQEEKDLIIKDLCARLPYNCQVFYEYVDDLDGKTYGYSLTLNTWCIDELVADKAIIKPYLRPMSSMTEEERKEYNDLYYQVPIQHSDGNAYRDTKTVEALHIDWLNKNMFDFRGLIPKGLALKAKEGMYTS